MSRSQERVWFWDVVVPVSNHSSQRPLTAHTHSDDIRPMMRKGDIVLVIDLPYDMVVECVDILDFGRKTNPPVSPVSNFLSDANWSKRILTLLAGLGTLLISSTSQT